MPNLPVEKLKDYEIQNPEKVKATIHSLRELNELGKPETDQEVEQRINDYFQFCEESILRPGIESLCCALHISRTTLFRWQRGEDCSRRRQELITQARGFISSFLEQVSLSGRLNPATSIFLLKNWCGYRDTISLESIAEENRCSRSIPDLPSIEHKYLGKQQKNPELPEFPEPDS